MSMAVGGGGADKTKCDMNVTPLIDVLLVLLIIFMVIAPITPKGLNALVPLPAQPNQQPSLADQRTVVIQVSKGGSIMINSEPIEESRLEMRLEDIFKTRNERVVFVDGDPDLLYQNVARVIDIAHGAGIDKVGLMTEKIKAGQ
ncbi:MAG: ExbD/TolR family protein [Bryobacteraceae bacterium]